MTTLIVQVPLASGTRPLTCEQIDLIAGLCLEVVVAAELGVDPSRGVALRRNCLHAAPGPMSESNRIWNEGDRFSFAKSYSCQ